MRHTCAGLVWFSDQAGMSQLKKSMSQVCRKYVAIQNRQSNKTSDLTKVNLEDEKPHSLLSSDKSSAADFSW